MRVLFVCFADSSHSQSWIGQFDGDYPQVRTFAGPFFQGGMYPPIPWSKTTYVLSKPTIKRGDAETHSWFPRGRLSECLSRRLIYRFSLDRRFFSSTIANWNPHIVHALSLNPAAIFTWEALKNISPERRPLFVVSSWGSDIYLGKDDPVERTRLKEILSNCDAFIGDCKRDVDIAVDLGLNKSKIPFDFGIPVNGGLKVERTRPQSNVEKRNIILIPKAYETVANKTLPILEALETMGEKLAGFEVHLLMCSPEVQRYLSTLSLRVQEKCKCHSYVSNQEVRDLMKRARVMVAPSISDGTPISLLEAMSEGVLPIVSPLDSIKEWVTDGHNGLFAHALYPDRIASAVDRALTDDRLFERAAQLNFDIIQKRANRSIIRTQVESFYEEICKNP